MTETTTTPRVVWSTDYDGERRGFRYQQACADCDQPFLTFVETATRCGHCQFTAQQGQS